MSIIILAIVDIIGALNAYTKYNFGMSYHPDCPISVLNHALGDISWAKDFFSFYVST